MKNMALILMITLNCYSNPGIISDLDDTLKITKTTEPSALGNILFSAKTFVGMPELLRKLAKSYRSESPIQLLSASPRLIINNVKRIVRNSRLPETTITLRKDILEPSVEYKFKAVSEMLKKYPQTQFVLIGDDSTDDPEVYQLLKETYPNSILSIYIRPVKGVHIPEGQIKYSTAYDIAYMERLAGRLSEQDLLELGTNILTSSKSRRLIPKHVACPSDAPYIARAGSCEANQMKHVIHKKVLTLCK